ncbi:PH domain-containing protein [Cryobacterium sp. TMT1-66-1]|uniref:PH domain-containing protein n=1 Tax=unclassified Cryobacterium TaxID=2649013 RepID=UPI00351A532A
MPDPDLTDVNLPAVLPPTADLPEPSKRLELADVGEWKRVSPKYVLVEIVGTIVNAVVVCGGASLLWLLLDATWAMWVGIVVLVLSIINLIFEPRRVRSIGYLLRDDDLLFRRGILFQRFVAVPYGRMQLIDITRGPVARWLGLADLKFVTAAATAGVSIPGLAEADAESLRDRLVELAESRRAGL